jgi:hypothetical protein
VPDFKGIQTLNSLAPVSEILQNLCDSLLRLFPMSINLEVDAQG